MVEGVILYSSFAFLKHYQSQGKNKLMNVVRGINFSVRDENLHSLATAYAFKVKTKDYSKEQLETARNEIVKVAELLYEHESAIIAKLAGKLYKLKLCTPARELRQVPYQSVLQRNGLEEAV